MKYTDLVEAVAKMPPAMRLSQGELDAALRVLVEQNWLVRYGSGELMSYKVNLRRRAGRQLDQDIWSALSERLGKGGELAQNDHDREG
jgi:hypothetical protein